MLVSLYHAFQQYRFRLIPFQKLLHFSGQIFHIATPDRMNTHRPGKKNKIGICHPGMRVPSVVEEICVYVLVSHYYCVHLKIRSYPAIARPFLGIRCSGQEL